jgi:KipI family sensor histidine kinase inhibitor
VGPLELILPAGPTPLSGQTDRVQIRRVGRDSLLLELDDAQQSLAVYDEARRRGVEATEIVPAARTVLFEGVRHLDALADEIGQWSIGSGHRPGRLVEVPTVYDGEDLDAVAELWGMSRDDVVETHTATEFRVAFCGFAPGFAYCTGLSEERAVPRRSSPRSRVPAGSVGLAGSYTGVYPSASPGGWQLIGRTELVLWDIDRDPPATLVPGTRVRFVAT